ncbi:hypothetical protein AX16_008751 [Volvariella volvacea WC 439]|nr:hypothetical protein AX16_008751 [Volvariella volvacea WC 439]
MFNVLQRLMVVVFILGFLFMSVIAFPKSLIENNRDATPVIVTPMQRRTTEPYFPDTPPSCPICAQDYGSINSCAAAVPVLQNFTNIIWNPGAFIDVIRCACVDTFQAAFPQCVDCFIRTNQTDVLETPDLPEVLEGMRRVCAIQSTLFGNVSGANGEVTPSPTPTSNAPPFGVSWPAVASLVVLLMGTAGLVDLVR